MSQMKIRLKSKKKTEENTRLQKPIRKKNRKKAAAVVVVILVIAVSGGAVSYRFLFAQTAEVAQYQEVTVQNGDLSLDFSGDGTTQVSTVSQIPEFDATVADLAVEEVYVASGDTVEEGDPILKLTADSVKEAQDYYTDAVSDATDTLSNAKSSYDLGVLEAQYTKESTVTTAEYADADYNASLTDLDQKVTDSKAALEDAQSKISEYTTALANNTYYTDNQIDEKKAAADEAQKAVDDAQKKYDDAVTTYNTLKKTVSDEIAALTSADLDTQAEQLKTDYASFTQAKDDIDSAQKDLEKAQSDLSQKQNESTQAQSNYEKQVQDATQQKEQLEGSLTQLQSAYEEALQNAVTEKVKVQNTYDTAVVDGEYAQTVYDNAVASLQSAVDTAQENLDNLTQEQTALNALEDGVITASQAGTIAAVTYEAEDVLKDSTAVVSYYDTDTILVTIDVDQSHINDIAVGDTADVEVSGVRRGGALTGTISSVATAATSDSSASKVSYEVQVSIDNSDGTLSTGLSATVTCNYGSLSDVNYLPVDAVSGIDGSSGKVKQYDDNGEVISVPVTIGEQTDSYVVITEGVSKDDTCLVEVGGQSDEEEK